MGKGDSPTQPLIPCVSILACWSGAAASRLSLAGLPDPPAAVAARSAPTAITAASSTTRFHIAHLAAALGPRLSPPRNCRNCRGLSRNNRKDDVRRMRRVGKDPVSGDARMLHRALRPARIRVDVEMREVAARDV